jgi:hypothetical protein
METSDRKIFDRLTLISRGIFVAAMILLGIALVLHLVWRASAPEPQAALQEDVEEIQEVTEEIQGTVNDLQADPAADDAVAEDLSGVDDKLDEVNEQLESLGEDLEVIETKQSALDYPIRGGINRIFTLLALCLGVFSILTAVVLAFALNLRQKNRVPLFDD